MNKNVRISHRDMDRIYAENDLYNDAIYTLLVFRYKKYYRYSRAKKNGGHNNDSLVYIIQHGRPKRNK